MIPRVKVNYRWQDLIDSVIHPSPKEEERIGLTKRLGNYQVATHVRLTPSGRAGLYLLLRSTPHRRVVLPAYTCKAVVEATRMAGKEIEFLDAESSGFNASLEKLTDLVDSESIFIATHQFGFPCDIERAVALCHRRGALVIEDCAASMGTRINGKLVGTFADAAFFSFDSTKLINVPLKSGFVTVQSPKWFSDLQAIAAHELSPMPALHQLRLLLMGAAYLVLENPLLYRLYHWLTLRRRFTADSPVISLERTSFYRFEMTRWQANLAIRQLEGLDAVIARRRDLYASYQRELAGCRWLQLPPKDELREWSCIRFPVLASGDKLSWYRNACKHDVDFAFSFTFLGSPQTFTHAHIIAQSILNLPFYPKLTDSELRRVTHVLRELDESFTS